MHITPFTQDDLDKPDFIKFEPGTHNFKVKITEEKTSDSGNAVLKVGLSLIKNNIESLFIIKDYFVFTESAKWKAKQFFKSIGKEELLKGSELDIKKIDNCSGIAEFEYETSEYNGKKYLKAKKYLPKETDDIPF
ncbi:MAG: DUF669 domain-containing protein [Candidatus Thorarchaeota archaeon]